jgi:hypothetical protein
MATENDVRRILLALAVLSSACGGSNLQLQLWGPELGDQSVAALVRVELRGSGLRPWERAPANLSGAADYGVYGRSTPARVPGRGMLFVRVALVTPTGDTLARSAWDTIRLEGSYNYWVVVAVADSSGPQDICTPQFKGYPVPPNRFVSGDSLLVDVSGMPKDAVC